MLLFNKFENSQTISFPNSKVSPSTDPGFQIGGVGGHGPRIFMGG